MGKLLGEKPGSIQMLGGGLRASTIRARVRCARRFLAWLAMQHEVAYPVSLQQVVDFMQTRLSEPCSRGALKSSHRGIAFLEEISASSRITQSQLYSVIYKEMLTSATPGKPTKQAPRMLATMIAALENIVVDSEAAPYLRIYSWWLLLQNWGTMRFSDHRRIIPSSVTFRDGTLSTWLLHFNFWEKTDSHAPSLGKLLQHTGR